MIVYVLTIYVPGTITEGEEVRVEGVFTTKELAEEAGRCCISDFVSEAGVWFVTDKFIVIDA